MPHKLQIITALILFVPVILYSACSSLDTKNAEKIREERIMKSGNFNGKIFINPVQAQVIRKGSMSGTFWKFLTEKGDRVPKHKPGPFKSDPAVFKAENKPGLRVTWISHSTVLIEIDGKRFLTDPVWCYRVSPVLFAGPTRFFEPPVSIEDLPPLDGVIISHDHYDHLDKAAVKKLAATGVAFHIPLGVGKYFYDWGISGKQVHEYDWWESVKIDDSHTLTAAPACHFSGHGLFDRNKTLWASWIITGEKHRVYFGGDSGYFPGYAEIGEKYGPFDLIMLEIGAYNESWAAIHLGPVNAVKAYSDLRAKALLPIHWGTFNLALHSWREPVEKLIDEAGGKDIHLVLPEPGQPVAWPGIDINSEWWKKD